MSWLIKIVKWVSAGQTLPFDVLLATPETERLFKQHGRVLGPKGLMPSEKRGTVIRDFASYMTHEEKGIQLNLDNEGKTPKGATLKVVVGKVLHEPTVFDISSNKTTTPSTQTSTN